MTEDEAHAVIEGFPGVEAATSYGRPSYKVNGKLFTRIRAEDASLVLQEVDFDEREMLVEAEPATFFFTDHYRNYPIVLARLEALDAATLRGCLDRRWRKIAGKAAIKARDTQAGPA